ncbi:MAG: hypothetical protein ACRD4K_10780 [Candidatus Acidiferrales bacterium]
MLTPSQMFTLFNELVFVLLGALLIVVAGTGRFAHPGHSKVWIILGVALLYWSLRIWMRRSGVQPRWALRVRAASLALVGALVLAIAWLPFSFGAPLLLASGCVLALRGILSAAFLMRVPRSHSTGPA